MPATEQAVRATDTYRALTFALRDRADHVTRSQWSLLDPADLDGTFATWLGLVAPALTELQRAGARLSAGYLTAFVAAELRARPTPGGSSVASPYVGVSQAGKPLPDALRAGVITTKQAIGDGREASVALALGLQRVARNASEDVMHTVRATLDDAITSDERVAGWRRVTSGGCGACLAAATGAIQHTAEVLRVHPHCHCSKEPVVAHVEEAIHRPTGGEIFRAMPAEQQDQLLGPEKAHLVRSGDVPLHALVEHEPMAALPDQITEAPLAALT